MNKINIISHRGYWQEVSEKNTTVAFERSFSLGFGTETDIRDFNGKLIISHDIPLNEGLSVESFFSIYKSYNFNGMLALNIKSDGLQKPLIELLAKYDINNYFLFDMSIPDAINSLNYDLNIYSRQSEYENEVFLYTEASGIWMDEFYSDWITNESIIHHVNCGKQVCIVSPELHGRESDTKWKQYRKISKKKESKNITICTDHPELAEKSINDKN